MTRPKDPELDRRHMTLRAACLSLRAYAHKLSIDPKATIRADELYGRLDAALYPKDEDRRREPLEKLLDAARADEASDYRVALDDVRERLAVLGATLKDPSAARERVAEIIAVIGAHLSPGEDDPS